MVAESAVTGRHHLTQPAQFESLITNKLRGKAKPEDRIVVVKSDKDVPYLRWIDLTSRIEDLGGVITLQLEEERTVQVP